MDALPISTLFIILLTLILCSAFFSGSETGMMALNRYRLRNLVRKNHRTAKRVSSLLERPDRLLGIILIGNTFANIMASAIATIIAIRLYGNIGIAAATILLTLVVLIFCEMAPKTLAAVYPQRVAFMASMPLKFLLKLLFPFVLLANWVANGLLALFNVNVGAAKIEQLTGEELRTVVFEAGKKIPIQHKEMLLSILDLEHVTVNHIMIPRSEVIGIDLEDDWDEIITLLRTSQHTRLPIFYENLDNVKGLIHLRAVLSLLAEDKLSKETLIAAAEDVYFVPEGTPLTTQILNFQQEKRRSALVVDEYGDILGLVTLEDILEEIVGEFTTDMADTGKEVHLQKDGSFLVDGGASLRDLNRLMNWELPTEGPTTLSGLIIEYLESIPNIGTCMLLNKYPVEVVQLKDNMVKTARVLPKLL